MNTPDIKSKLLTYVISHRLNLKTESLTDFALRAASAGINYFQIREKDLSDRQLFELAKKIIEVSTGSGMKILINDRLDIAQAAGADGVHLGSNSAPLHLVRETAGPQTVIFHSAHNLEEALTAQAGGADFITLSPVFETLSKKMTGIPLGIARFQKIAVDLQIPIFALGGIEERNIIQLRDCNICGIAAITLFQNSGNLPQLVTTINNRSF